MPREEREAAGKSAQEREKGKTGRVDGKEKQREELERRISSK